MGDFDEYSKYFTLIQEKTNPFPYFKAADIVVVPSREDPFPLVVLEAMSLGKPTVIFKEAGGIHEAVKDSGEIISDFNIQNFIDAVEKLSLDKSERERLGSKAKEYQYTYDSEFALPKIRKVISKLL